MFIIKSKIQKIQNILEKKKIYFHHLLSAAFVSHKTLQLQIVPIFAYGKLFEQRLRQTQTKCSQHDLSLGWHAHPCVYPASLCCCLCTSWRKRVPSCFPAETEMLCAPAQEAPQLFLLGTLSPWCSGQTCCCHVHVHVLTGHFLFTHTHTHTHVQSDSHTHCSLCIDLRSGPGKNKTNRGEHSSPKFLIRSRLCVRIWLLCARA